MDFVYNWNKGVIKHICLYGEEIGLFCLMKNDYIYIYNSII